MRRVSVSDTVAQEKERSPRMEVWGMPCNKAFTTEHTFEAGTVGAAEGGVIPRNRVLGITAAWCTHFVECRNTVSRFEFGDTWPYGMDNACDIIALVQRS